MAKKKLSQKVVRKVRQYVKILEADNVKVEKVYVFGSYAKGNPHKWSDIDVCVVSPKFKNAFSAMQYLWGKRLEDDLSLFIEPVGFSPEDFEDEDALIHEIKRTGIEVKI